jgi:hypothetical protein
MKPSNILVSFALSTFFLFAQVPVKTDLIHMLVKVPAPPLSVKESFSKTVVRGNGDPTCTADKIFFSIEQEIKNFESEFETAAKGSAREAVPDASSDQAKKMSDPEMKKKMKSMTKEEKMAMAMEMMKSAPAGTPPMDPPPIRAALDEWQKIYNDTQNEFNRSAAAQKEESELNEDNIKAHRDIDAWERSEIAKLPRISSGEMDAPDPARVTMVRMAASDKHIALADKRLAVIRSRWDASAKRTKERYDLFHKKLMSADYAAGSKNFSTKKVLADAQMMILKEIVLLEQLSRAAWEESASWQARRITIEQER